MNWKGTEGRWIIALTLLVLPGVIDLMAAPAVQATVLTFDTTAQVDFPTSTLANDPSAGGFSDYGDRVSSASETSKGPGGAYTYSYGTAGGPTTSIVAEYQGNDPPPFEGGHDQGMYIYNTGGFPTTTVLFPYYVSGAVRRVITLTADTNDQVSLQSFRIEPFAGSRSIAYLAVIGINSDNSEVTLWSESGTIALPTGGTTYTSADFGGDLDYRSIAIDFQPISGESGNDYGFDNIQFGELLPEPSSLALLGAGALMVARRRRASGINHG